MKTTAYTAKKSISRILTEELAARGIGYDTNVTGLGMRWNIEGESLTMREAANKYLVGGFKANV